MPASWTCLTMSAMPAKSRTTSHIPASANAARNATPERDGRTQRWSAAHTSLAAACDRMHHWVHPRLGAKNLQNCDTCVNHWHKIHGLLPAAVATLLLPPPGWKLPQPLRPAAISGAAMVAAPRAPAWTGGCLVDEGEGPDAGVELVLHLAPALLVGAGGEREELACGRGEGAGRAGWARRSGWRRWHWRASNSFAAPRQCRRGQHGSQRALGAGLARLAAAAQLRRCARSDTHRWRRPPRPPSGACTWRWWR